MKNWPKTTPKPRTELECHEIFPERLFFPHNIHKYFLKAGDLQQNIPILLCLLLKKKLHDGTKITRKGS